MLACIHARTHTHTHTHAYTRTHTHMHAHTRACTRAVVPLRGGNTARRACFHADSPPPCARYIRHVNRPLLPPTQLTVAPPRCSPAVAGRGSRPPGRVTPVGGPGTRVKRMAPSQVIDSHGLASSTVVHTTRRSMGIGQPMSYARGSSHLKGSANEQGECRGFSRSSNKEEDAPRSHHTSKTRDTAGGTTHDKGNPT